jgi:RNA polymerase sigma-70 factor, ECF subfamily
MGSTAGRAVARAAVEEEPGRRAESVLETDPDVQLMVAACHGDEGAFPALFRRHHARVLNYCLRMVGNLDRAEELAQETFVNLYRARHRYQPRAHFVTYLFRVATNLCLNEKRRLARWGRPAEVDAPEAKELEDASLETIEDQMILAERWDRVRDVVARLPARQSAALFATRFEGLSQLEASAALGVTIQSLKSLLFRATRTLRRELAIEFELEGAELEEEHPRRGRRRRRAAAVPGTGAANRLPI